MQLLLSSAPRKGVVVEFWVGSLGLLRSAMGDVAALDQLIFKKTEGNKRGIPEAFSPEEVFEHLFWVFP